jgi:hypothetical protein
MSIPKLNVIFPFGLSSVCHFCHRCPKDGTVSRSRRPWDAHASMSRWCAGAVVSDAVQDVVFGNLATGWEGLPLRRDGLECRMSSTSCLSSASRASRYSWDSFGKIIDLLFLSIG